MKHLCTLETFEVEILFRIHLHALRQVLKNIYILPYEILYNVLEFVFYLQSFDYSEHRTDCCLKYKNNFTYKMNLQ